MEIKPAMQYTVTFTAEEFKFVTHCLAQCAGIKGIRVHPGQASNLNVKMLKAEQAHLQQQLDIAQNNLTKARRYDASFIDATEPDQEPGESLPDPETR